jgi:bifunctional non-homologous end joining protein LigD
MLAPMLASIGEAPLVDPAYVYEPKYDGIRALVDIAPGGSPVQLWSRLGNDKTSQFPEIAGALSSWARRRRDRIVLDGEIVALDADGQPAGFQRLQGRIHVKGEPGAAGRVAIVFFDVLRIGTTDLREQPLTERRVALESLLEGSGTSTVRLSEQVAGDGRALYDRALANGWEGLIAKHAASKYRSGKRSPDWIKLKIVHEQEFVLGGWTEPRHTRAYFGALLLGVYDGDRLVYVGHTGTGFDERELARVMAKLRPLETGDCPFVARPKTNERPHWVRPELVAQVKFTEWTDDDKLRHPVYLGLRDDRPPREVVREGETRLHESSSGRKRSLISPPEANMPPKRRATSAARDVSSKRRSTRAVRSGSRGTTDADVGREVDAAVGQLRAIEDGPGDGVLHLPDGVQLKVTNLKKVFWPTLKITKGELFRYYAQVSPFILPVLADRPLVMKRYPNGVDAKPFYQHRAEEPARGVRVERVAAEDRRPQLIGGDLPTLLYTCQLAAISQDPWFSRVQSPGYADQVAFDLDPSDDVPFSQVLDVARWVHDELDALGVFGLPKTSGSSGLHIYIPLAPRTRFDAGLLFCQLIATLVSEKHPKHATVERSVRARGRRVYIDYLQNIEGKTLASAYSVRANEFAGVSAPLGWSEVDAGVRLEDFTIRTVLSRIEKTGDLWAPIRSQKGADLRAIAE